MAALAAPKRPPGGAPEVVGVEAAGAVEVVGLGPKSPPRDGAAEAAGVSAGLLAAGPPKRPPPEGAAEAVVPPKRPPLAGAVDAPDVAVGAELAGAALLAAVLPNNPPEGAEVAGVSAGLLAAAPPKRAPAGLAAGNKDEVWPVVGAGAAGVVDAAGVLPNRPPPGGLVAGVVEAAAFPNSPPEVVFVSVDLAPNRPPDGGGPAGVELTLEDCALPNSPPVLGADEVPPKRPPEAGAEVVAGALPKSPPEGFGACWACDCC